MSTIIAESNTPNTVLHVADNGSLARHHILYGTGMPINAAIPTPVNASYTTFALPEVRFTLHNEYTLPAVYTDNDYENCINIQTTDICVQEFWCDCTVEHDSECEGDGTLESPWVDVYYALNSLHAYSTAGVYVMLHVKGDVLLDRDYVRRVRRFVTPIYRAGAFVILEGGDATISIDSSDVWHAIELDIIFYNCTDMHIKVGTVLSAVYNCNMELYDNTYYAKVRIGRYDINQPVAGTAYCVDYGYAYNSNLNKCDNLYAFALCNCTIGADEYGTWTCVFMKDCTVTDYEGITAYNTHIYITGGCINNHVNIHSCYIDIDDGYIGTDSLSANKCNAVVIGNVFMSEVDSIDLSVYVNDGAPYVSDNRIEAYNTASLHVTAADISSDGVYNKVTKCTIHGGYASVYVDNDAHLHCTLEDIDVYGLSTAEISTDTVGTGDVGYNITAIRCNVLQEGTPRAATHFVYIGTVIDCVSSVTGSDKCLCSYYRCQNVYNCVGKVCTEFNDPECGIRN